MDEGAPESWHQLQKDGVDVLDGLDADTRRDLDRWRAKRSSLLPDRIRQELDAKLEECDLDQKPSLPFLKLHVESLARCTESGNELHEEAFLTVWNPSSEQLGFLQEGKALRFKNLDTRGKGYNDKIQFSANAKTPIDEISCETQPARAQVSDEGHSNLVRVCVLSKRLNESDVCPKSKINVFGVALAGVMETASWTVSITDKSTLQLQIRGSSVDSSLEQLLQTTTMGSFDDNPLAVVEFRQLTLLPFDNSFECAVAEFDADSVFNLTPSFSSAATMRRWSKSASGRRQLMDQSLRQRIGVSPPIPLTSNFRHAVGFILGFDVIPSRLELMVKVDCGGPYVRKWKFPLSLLSVLIESASRVEDTIALSPQEEDTIEQLRSIGEAFRARQSLFCFTLEKPALEGADFEVSHLSIVDTEALAALYSRMLEHSY